MPRLTTTIDASLLGISSSMDLALDADNGGVCTPTVTAANAGTLTTRTDNDTGVITADDAGHGVVSTNKVDVYWDGGVRYNMTATVAGTAVSIDGGAGDNLPDDETAVTFKKPQVEEHLFTGDDCLGIVAAAPDYPAVITFQEADGTIVKAIVLDEDTPGYVWNSESAETNPLAGGDIAQISISHGSTEGSSTRTGVAYART